MNHYLFHLPVFFCFCLCPIFVCFKTIFFHNFCSHICLFYLQTHIGFAIDSEKKNYCSQFKELLVDHVHHIDDVVNLASMSTMKIDIFDLNVTDIFVKIYEYKKEVLNILDEIQKLVEKNDLLLNIIVKKKSSSI